MSTRQSTAGAFIALERDPRIEELLGRMTLAEKIGQMSQVESPGQPLPEDFLQALRAGRIGAVLNEVDVEAVNELQRIAVQESRLGIPLLVGRDVIHGFRTIFPIPLGQAASWNPELVRNAARVAAAEAATAGINWTFAPMLDVTRDPRWGRIAESLGEDPCLAGRLGAAMVEGFQGDDLAGPAALAACAKHFAGYGACESGRDYNTTNIPESELRNVHLRPFRAALDSGARTVMTSFSDLNGIPASANEFLLRRVLREEWAFDGFVVSDWASIGELRIHGLTASDRESALAAAAAGVNMEMASTTYRDHLAGLVEAGMLDEVTIDDLVMAILQVKFDLGLFQRPSRRPGKLPSPACEEHLSAAREAALQSAVLLKNDKSVLPLAAEAIERVAVIGPLADAPYEQLGTWVFDGDPALSVTPLAAIRERLGDERVSRVQAMETSRSRSRARFEAAKRAVESADVAILFIGEESILSGEAHSRADIGLPGNQAQLVRELRTTGKPVVAVVLAGRPLTLGDIVDDVDAILYAWHPGTMAGPAIADLLFGSESPSGKLPVTFPRMVGQVPIYYAQKNTGRPPAPDRIVHIDDIDALAPQTSLGMTAFHLDAGFEPLWPFGYGLSYTTFEYADLELSAALMTGNEPLTVAVTVTNTGRRQGTEVVQLYLRDLVGSLTRPVRELKGFRRVPLEPGQSQRVEFRLTPADLAFHGRDMRLAAEPGDFHVWVGGDSGATLGAAFRFEETD